MVSAIVLAAGLSTRMEQGDKLLLPFNGKPILVTIVDNLLDAGIKDVIVVSGYNAPAIDTILQNLAVRIIYNPSYEKGITTSIQTGIAIANGDGYMICMGDMPSITTGEYAHIVSFFEKQPEINHCICVPTYTHHKGNPVVFSSYYKEEIFNHTNMECCNQIIQNHKENMHELKMQTDNILKDINTPLDYNKVVDFVNH